MGLCVVIYTYRASTCEAEAALAKKKRKGSMSQKPKKQAPKNLFNRAMAAGRLPMPLEMASLPGQAHKDSTILDAG